jgi:hypothetical protein
MATEQQFLAEIDHLKDDEISAVARQLIEWVPKLTGQTIEWGTGKGNKIRGTAQVEVGGRRRTLFALRATGDVSLTFDQIRDNQGVGEDRVRELKDRLNRIRGMDIPIPVNTDTERNYRDKFLMRHLADPSEMETFRDAWAWLLADWKGNA